MSCLHVMFLSLLLLDGPGSIPLRGPRADSIEKAYVAASRSLKTRELGLRADERRALQRRGYVTTLEAVARGDALGGLFSYLRLRAQIWLGMSHIPLVYYVPITQPPPPPFWLPPVTGAPSPPYEITLEEDWAMPADPWRRP